MAVVETSPGQDAIAEGLLDLLKPAIQQLDLHVHSVRESQVELREHIDNLATELCRINEHQKVALDLDPYVKKLLNARRRVVLVNNILQNAQERLRRLNHNVAKETARRKTMLEASGVFATRSPSKPWACVFCIIQQMLWTVPVIRKNVTADWNLWRTSLYWALASLFLIASWCLALLSLMWYWNENHCKVFAKRQAAANICCF